MSINEISIGMILAVQSYWDIKDKEIPVLVNLLGGIGGIVLSLLQRRSLKEVLLALVPSLVCLLISFLTREAIGYGDGLLLSVVGMFVSYEVVLEIVFLAISFAGILALFLLVVCHKRGKEKLAFVPFLFGAWLMHFFV